MENKLKKIVIKDLILIRIETITTKNKNGNSIALLELEFEHLNHFPNVIISGYTKSDLTTPMIIGNQYQLIINSQTQNNENLLQITSIYAIKEGSETVNENTPRLIQFTQEHLKQNISYHTTITIKHIDGNLIPLQIYDTANIILKENPKFCSIEEFLTNPYYLGNYFFDEEGKSLIYPYWIKKIEDFYNSNKSMGAFYGDVGCGKTTAQIICMLYDFCNLQMLENPYEKFQFTGDIVFALLVNSHLQSEQQIKQINHFLDNMPFIQNLKKNNNYKYYIYFKTFLGNQTKALLSYDIAGIMIDDIHLLKYPFNVILESLKYASNSRKSMEEIGHFIWGGLMTVFDNYDSLPSPCKIPLEYVYEIRTNCFEVRAENSVQINKLDIA